MNMADHTDSEAFQVGLPDQGSRTRDVVPCFDQDQIFQSKDPVVLPNSDDL